MKIFFVLKLWSSQLVSRNTNRKRWKIKIRRNKSPTSHFNAKNSHFVKKWGWGRRCQNQLNTIFNNFLAHRLPNTLYLWISKNGIFSIFSYVWNFESLRKILLRITFIWLYFILVRKKNSCNFQIKIESPVFTPSPLPHAHTLFIHLLDILYATLFYQW